MFANSKNAWGFGEFKPDIRKLWLLFSTSNALRSVEWNINRKTESLSITVLCFYGWAAKYLSDNLKYMFVLIIPLNISLHILLYNAWVFFFVFGLIWSIIKMIFRERIRYFLGVMYLFSISFNISFYMYRDFSLKFISRWFLKTLLLVKLLRTSMRPLNYIVIIDNVWLWF